MSEVLLLLYNSSKCLQSDSFIIIILQEQYIRNIKYNFLGQRAFSCFSGFGKIVFPMGTT